MESFLEIATPTAGWAPNIPAFLSDVQLVCYLTVSRWDQNSP